MALSVLSLEARREIGVFDLYSALRLALDRSGVKIMPGDIVVVSTKYVSVSQGRTVSISDTRVSGEGRRMARRFRIGPEMAEIILRESDLIMGGLAGFVLASTGGMMAPNAGIDASNARPGRVILYPAGPYRTAECLRRKIFLDTGAMVGVILADSRLMPGRVGTTGVAVACAGMDPVQDMRGDTDLEGRPLKVTLQAVADNLASAGNYAMGEGSQSRPFAILRGSGARLRYGHVSDHETSVDPSECVYVRGLSERES